MDTAWDTSRGPGRLCAVAVDGTERWRFETNLTMGVPPTVVDGTVYVGGHLNRSRGYLYAVETDHEASSRDSRVRLGAVGGHGRRPVAD